MNSHFFAMLFRMKYINRWALMRNTRNETLAEHSLETAFIAHALAVIENKRFGGNYDPSMAALLAMYHDAPEIITGDLPTPIKYYNPEIKNVYHNIEDAAAQRLLNLLPEDLKEEYNDIFYIKEDKMRKLVKAADKLSALIKCLDELSLDNKDFREAEKSTRIAVEETGLPSVKVFMDEFLQSFSLSLDQQQ